RRVEDLDDVRVQELAGERGFGEKRLAHHLRRLLGDMLVELEDLDRDVAVGERVAREIDAAGRPAADLAGDRVLADMLFELELDGQAAPPRARSKRGSLSEEARPVA